MYSLREGIGARRLTKFRSQAAVQLLLMQSCSDVYIRQHKHMPQGSVSDVMRTLDWIASNARDVDSDTALRKRLAMQQAEDKVRASAHTTLPFSPHMCFHLLGPTLHDCMRAHG